jgi:AP endonuclease-1
MPPKRAMSSSSGKRKVDSDPGSERTKKAKVAAAVGQGHEAAAAAAEQTQTGFAPNGQPTNKLLPVNISFPPRADGKTHIAAWNICGLASSQKKVRKLQQTACVRALWRFNMV